MLKLSLPTRGQPLQAAGRHPRVMRVVALSGGYSRDEANRLSERQHGA
jgi:fructose-bisphosphate aldolase class I